MRAPIKTLPSIEKLNELFSYDAEAGLLSWKSKLGSTRADIGFNNKTAGKPVGTITERGYLTVGIRANGKPTYYLVHRIIWKMMTGADPEFQIDHIDGNRLNNKWENFRQATNGQNIQNSKLRSDNKSGIKGVHWSADRRKWEAVITANGISRRIGRFNNLEDATLAISIARHENHGEFARNS